MIINDLIRLAAKSRLAHINAMYKQTAKVPPLIQRLIDEQEKKYLKVILTTKSVNIRKWWENVYEDRTV